MRIRNFAAIAALILLSSLVGACGWTRVKKWNGNVPQVSGGATPIIDLRSGK